MKILMVSPFPPLRDGVGKYAAQEVAALRAEGHDVEVLAPVACAAHHLEDFKTWAGGLAKLRAYARRYDRVILQYQPAHFHWRSEGLARMASNFWMMVAFRTIRNLHIVCHEVEYPAPGWPAWRPEKLFDRLAWAGARHVEFHTAREVDEMEARLGVRPRHTELRDHGRYFRPAVTEDRSAARRRLGLPERVPVFLCIGFIQPHKGFDRAIRAFRRVPGSARLVVVGSVGTETPAHRSYMHELHFLAAGDERVDVHERMVSDDEFDRWIIASDVVVLPYREIWSSGVLERAHLFDRPVIATPVGGMGEQLHERDTAVSSDEELSEAMASVVGGGRPVGPVSMSVGEAIVFVDEEARRRGAWVGGTPVERALHDLSAARGVYAVTLPSSRPVIGRFLDLMKRVMRRGLGWLLTPLLGQVNHFQELTVRTLEEMAAVQRELSRSQAASGVTSPQDAEVVRLRLRAHLRELEGPVLHVGSGEGELFRLARVEGVDARDVDAASDAASTEAVDAIQGGGPLSVIRRLPSGSFAGVIGFGVEDLPGSVAELLDAAHRVVRPGGMVFVETREPLLPSSVAGAADSVAAAARRVGFVDVEVLALTARPPREPLEVGADAPEWARRLTKSLDEELDALAEHAFGSPSTVLVARVGAIPT